MRIEIRHRRTGAVLYAGEGESIWQVVEAAVAAKANLGGADLGGAYLRGAYFRGADLRGANLGGGANLRDADLRDADLRGADFRDAYFRGAHFRGADLRGADLRGADLRGADLRGADLRGADLGGACLRDADLRDADLRDANLRGADFRDANLRGACLRDANLRGATNSGLVIASTRILPEGTLIGWKKCQRGVIVKLRIPEAAKRSNAFGRKCRAEYVETLEVIGAEVGLSIEHIYGGGKEYRAGETVRAHKWCEDYTQECAGGIHFYITREEAEAHS